MQFLLALAVYSAYVNALPLNINLGAYSPALVVGDGEISFGGKQDVSNLMNALEGAAVSGAAQAAAAAPAAAVAQPQAQVAQPQAAAAVQQATDAQITSLQGMGKEIAPRVVQLTKDGAEKRDLTGFNAALNYATGALKTGPEVQLGTGEGGSGVGIIQKAGGAPATARPAARDIVAREAAPAPKLKTTVTTMFVRGGPALAPSNLVRKDETEAIEKRAPSPSVIDGVNLNMAEGQVAELTFVETRAVDDDE